MLEHPDRRWRVLLVGNRLDHGLLLLPLVKRHFRPKCFEGQETSVTNTVFPSQPRTAEGEAWQAGCLDAIFHYQVDHGHHMYIVASGMDGRLPRVPVTTFGERVGLLDLLIEWVVRIDRALRVRKQAKSIRASCV